MSHLMREMTIESFDFLQSSSSLILKEEKQKEMCRYDGNKEKGHKGYRLYVAKMDQNPANTCCTPTKAKETGTVCITNIVVVELIHNVGQNMLRKICAPFSTFNVGNYELRFAAVLQK